MYNKVELCGVDTAGLPVLSEEEKRALLIAAHAGDKGRAPPDDRGQPAAGAQRGAKVLAAGRKPRRPVPGGVHRAHQGHRPLRPGAGRPVLDLRRPHDRGGDTALSAGQQRGAGQPLDAGHRLPGHAGPGTAGKNPWAGSPPWPRRPTRWVCPAGKWRRPWHRWWSRSAWRNRSTATAATPSI